MHMKLDLARLQRRVVDGLVTDLAKFFDVIGQDTHPIPGARVGLGDANHLATHTDGFLYALICALGSRIPWRGSWALPREQSRESMQEPRPLSHSCDSWISRVAHSR